MIVNFSVTLMDARRGGIASPVF